MRRAVVILAGLVTATLLAHAPPRPQHGTRPRPAILLSNTPPVVTALRPDNARTRDARLTPARHLPVLQRCLVIPSPPAAGGAGDSPRPALACCKIVFFRPDEPARYQDIANYVRVQDPYLSAADLADYLACQARVERAYGDRAGWMHKVVKNIAHSGRFSSDRTIGQYASEIWNVEPVHIEIDPYVDPT